MHRFVSLITSDPDHYILGQLIHLWLFNMAWSWNMNFEEKVQPPVCETLTKRIANFCVNLGEKISKFMQE